MAEQIREDGRISDDYKTERIGEVQAAAEQKAAAILGQVADRADRLVSAYTKPLELDAPESDGPLLEAKMGNAKHDIELAVKGAESIGDVLDMLEDLVNEGDPVTVYLLLSTRYGERLLNSLDGFSLIPSWRRKKEMLKRALKGEAAPRGVDAARKLTHLPTLLEHSLAMWKQGR